MRPLFRKASKNRAVALVIVLVMLVLMAVLIVAFYSSVKTELVSATSYASGADARNLGDSAVQIAQAQIAAATKGVDAGNKPLLWASQPGMIRTWTSDATGSAGSFYKLYSSSSLVVPGAGFSMAAEAPPANWATQTARYVDLNAPVLVQDGNGTISANGNTFSARYPIMDPALAGPKNGAGDVEGFEIDGAPGYAAGTYPPDPAYNPAKDPNPAAMPVEWLYQLADGTITTPTFDPGTPGKISSFVPAPTQSNPITARLAFWTDDETAKINVNTASEGTFWDMPRAASNDELAMARNIPVQSEFQRVAGHPLGVSLSPVLNKLLPRLNATNLANTAWTLADNASSNSGYNEIKPYLALNPRTSIVSTNGADQTSKAGTQRTVRTPAVTTGLGLPISLRSSRLYSTPDEFLFSDTYASAQRSINNFGTATQAQAAQAISRYRFLLTANARADETTPFNTPKVSIWPLQSDLTRRTVKERLIVQAATIGAKPYFFQRLNVIGDTGLSLNQISSVSKTMDYTDIPRNQEIYGYLQKLTGGLGNIPGYGAKFTDKWSNLGRDRVLTQIFDIVRAQVNILSTQNFATGRESYQFAFDEPATTPAGDKLKLGAKYIFPIQIPSGSTQTRGFGRYVTMSEAMLVFRTYSRHDDMGTPANPSDDVDRYYLRAALLLQPYTPSSQPSVRFAARIRVTGLDTLTVENADGVKKPLGFPKDIYFRFCAGSGAGTSLSTSQAFRPYQIFYHSIVDIPGPNYGKDLVKTLGKPAASPSTFVYNEDTHYPLVSDEVEVTPPPRGAASDPLPVNPWRTFAISAPSASDLITVQFVRPFAIPPTIPADPTGVIAPFAAADVLQTLNFQFPASPQLTLLTKNLPPANPDPFVTTGGAAIATDGTTRADDFEPTNTDLTRSVIFGSTLPHRGDLRLLALMADVPKEWFGPHPDYAVASQLPLVAFASGDGWKTTTYTKGRYAHSLRSELNGSGRSVLPPAKFEEASGDMGKILAATTAGVDIRLDNTGLKSKPGGLAAGLRLTQAATTITPAGMQAALGQGGIAGDWASNFGFNPDGAVITSIDMTAPGNWNYGSYFSGDTAALDSGTFYEPTRQISSAVCFGDLLTTNATGDLQGWQSLLFNPVPAGDLTHFGLGFSSNAHYGAKILPDYLMLDFFWLPVVEPYALSESFSTAGKVNPNYQIAPFSYIHRSTALRGALKSVRIGSIPDVFTTTGANGNQPNAVDYKNSNAVPTTPSVTPTRLDLNLARLNGTIKIFDDFFANGNNSLRTASEVCTLPLVPAGETSTGIATFWGKNRLTSDTLRESPYKQLYSRLTTKSNTYTVHYRVQALTQTPVSVAAGTWDETKDVVRAEYRGSSTIERYIDPNTPGIPDYATDASPAPLSNFARFRTISNRQFTP